MVPSTPASKPALTPRTLESFADEVKERLGLQEFAVHLTREGYISLNNLVVPRGREHRNRGKGSAAVRALVEVADAFGRKAILSPATKDDHHGTTSRARLVEFYKRFGFVENKGRRKDFTISEGMIRDAAPARQIAAMAAISLKPAFNGQASTSPSGGPAATLSQGSSAGLRAAGASRSAIPPVTLYHATAAPTFTAFSEASVGRGGDANSSLGVHLAERPGDTLRYVTDHAGQPVSPAARVLVVEASIERALLTWNSNDFFGTDEHGEQILDTDAFAARREALRADGYDAVCTEGGMFDDDGAGVWVVLDPQRLRVVGEMSLAEAADSEATADYEAVAIVAGEIFPPAAWKADADAENEYSMRA